ncbi:helix-turn-helix transcriptional regulator [Burkholderia multivorans]|uniref:helix-turn-helix domain-containing protein n=1 Tax=Burkholderia multivorans TaxID=87883 RepID=UPI0011B2539B|nr:helix-turn-helix transcriptional regulator [Burkholderia multivorans]MBU9291636.1 helix-turn-helix transcriptional regulator [Burkholderia multivorans]MBU9434223.1 helix-turn-helix transcriptional regulator [Burkholderia multivorans]MBU9563935.1 helix-turn-helix transcriptional regulator [Burkholderia multivorans]
MDHGAVPDGSVRALFPLVRLGSTQQFQFDDPKVDRKPDFEYFTRKKSEVDMDLKKARNELRVTQQVIAERIGVSQQTIARWESGKSEIPAKYLKDLAILFGCSVSDLLDKGRKSLRSESDSDVPFGTLHIRFQRSAVQPARQPAASDNEAMVDESTRDRYFPITDGERDRLVTLLDKGGVSSEPMGWISFSSLDNRLVFVNPREIERIAFVSDDVEAMPSYEHVEVYKLAREVAFGNVPSDEELNDESCPYSLSLAQKAKCVVDELGEVAALWLDGVAVDSIHGEREYFYLDDATLADLHGLELEGEYASQDTFLNLYAEGYYRSTFFRLGSLRSIEVPLDRYSDWLNEELQGT